MDSIIVDAVPYLVRHVECFYQDLKLRGMVAMQFQVRNMIEAATTEAELNAIKWGD